MFEIISDALGLDVQKLNLWQMVLRTVVIYLTALLLVRLGGDRRFLGKHAPFDVILSIIFGATLSRAINGSAAFFPTLGAGAVLVGMHWLLAAIAFHIPSVEKMIKGSSRILIRDGQINNSTLKKSHLSHKDLESSLRLQAKITDLEQVELARLECNGKVSFIPKEKSPRVIEVAVKEGVQTLRIEL